ncbi:MAG TPA: hypothetical protein VME20_12045 [Acidimicrobiales bacterium]|nr:hypothetical protein [Acidimicrobiales bacterium]
MAYRWPALLAGAALAFEILAPVGATNAGATRLARAGAEPTISAPAQGLTSTGQGLIAFRDDEGIGVANPVTGRERMLLTVPPACASNTALPDVQLGGPVWAVSGGAAPELYFWLTDWQTTASACRGLPLPPSSLSGAAVLVEADPITGTLRALAAAPTGLPCQPGADLAVADGTLAFTNGDCDEPGIETLPVDLPSVAEPEGVTPSVPPGAFCDCPVAQRLLGTGPEGTFVFEESGTQGPKAPPPSLQWFGPASRTGHLLSPRPPRSVRGDLVGAAAAPTGSSEAFAAGTAGAGALDLQTGAWSPEPLPACRAACSGASSVSFSSDGKELAIAANGTLVIDSVKGGGPARALMGGSGVSEVSWSGPMTTAVPGTAGALAPPPPARLSRVLQSLWASFSGFWGAGLEHTWRVAPAPGGTAVPETWPVMVVSPPGTPTALLMASDQVALAAGADGDMWRSTDGGRTWKVVAAHCAELQMVTPDYPPCQIRDMAVLPGGVVVAGGPLGVWRSADRGLKWQRNALAGYVVQEGPWAAGSTALVLVEPASPGGQPETNSTGLTLLSSTDGARSWHKLLAVPRRDPSRGAEAIFFEQLFVLGPGRVAALYRAGDCSLPADLRVTLDGGATWTSIAVAPLLAPAAVVQTSASRLVVGSSFCGSAAPSYGQGIFAHATTAGGPWAPLRLPSGYYELDGFGGSGHFPKSAMAVEAFSVAGLAFPGAGVGVAVGATVPTGLGTSGNPEGSPPAPYSQDMVLVSRDGGSSWADASVPGPGSLAFLSCAGPGHCLAAQA